MIHTITYVFGGVIVISILAGGIYWYSQSKVAVAPVSQSASVDATDIPLTAPPEDKSKTVIGTSPGGRAITAYHFGEGEREVLFVGGIHGGYAWNTVLVAYELMDYLVANASTTLSNLRVTVIPVLNPDGLFATVGTDERFSSSQVPKDEATKILGRYNGNKVDLNRNFDCDWQASAKWQSRTVSGGTKAFSEPESQAIQAYVAGHRPLAVVAWYSAAGGVFASNCHDGVLSETSAIVDVYAKASGYKAYEKFNYYEITGDMVNWLAKEGIPAISVLLTDHTNTEWDKNRKGVDALLKRYAQ